MPRGAALALLGAVALALSLAAAEDDWKFDVVHLRDGRSLRGLVLAQTATEVQLRYVLRRPGAPTFATTVSLPRQEVASVELLDARERERLAARLKELDPSGKKEAERMAALRLEPAPWGKDGKALRYRSVHFTLVSNAPEDVVRRAAVRLDQVYAAYARHLPPRAESAEPTTVLLAASTADYQDLVKERGQSLLNPAFYDPGRNQIVCGSELRKLGEELERVRQKHRQALADLVAREAQLLKLYKGRVPPQLLQPIRDTRRQIEQAEEQNDRAFRQATQRLFQRLYHEAFHAYLDHFVYPGREQAVPRWLNEGLAQIFETALVEAGELRVGHVEKEWAGRLEEARRKSELVPLAELLRSGPKQFLVVHASDRQSSDRYYLTSWALAFYLTFERKLLGGRALDDYVRALGGGADPVAAFRDLTGQPLPQFEQEFQQYLKKLTN
jgi:hypothetical protein